MHPLLYNAASSIKSTSQNRMPLPFHLRHFLFFLFLLPMSTSSATSLTSFLLRLQSAALETLGPAGFDPKLYVDLPLSRPLPLAVSAFDRLPRVNGSVPGPVLKSFLSDYTLEAGSDLVVAEPPDFSPDPEGFLPNVRHLEVRKWALEVHSLWRNLTRRVAADVTEDPDSHTLLPLSEPVVVPGSRFREVYYWDSYWTIRGLLVSKMYDTARSIVRNLISLIDVYGFVPNGARSYYSNRSQPPLLSAMVSEIYNRTGDLKFVAESLPSLLKEHSFWNSGIHKVSIKDLQGHIHSLSRYYAMWDKPRPESATIDEESASKLLTMSEKESFYREVASTAETGWDFSSRWMRNSSDMTTLATTSIIPVDLNAYIYKMELDIAYFANLTGDNSTSEMFLKASKARQAAIESIFWNEEMGQWLDYWLTNNNNCEEHKFDVRKQNHNIYASNFIPLWIQKNTSGGGAVEKVMKSFQNSGLLHPAGIATSLSNTGQQWDFPNGWAPLQHMIVEGFVRSVSKEAWSLAEDIAVRWLRTNYAAYKKTGTMQEKYDVEACGEVGGGGEYNIQTGFGWSNGVVLAFLEEFGWSADKEINCQ